MAQTLKFGKGTWATKTGSSMAYNDQNGNYKPLPFNVERDSIATRVNKQGLIEVVGKDKLRIDYTDSAKGVALLEPSRTNLILNSQKLSLSPIKNGTFTDDFAISPDGTQNATKLTATDTDPYFYQSVSFAAATYTASIYVKGIGNSIGKKFRFAIGGSSSNPKLEIPSEWSRFEYSVSMASGSANTGLEIIDPAVVGDEVLVWGWQVEQSDFATSYIPTSGSTVTRQADVVNGSGNSEVFNDSEGVLFADIAALSNDVTNKFMSVSNGSISETLRIAYIGGTDIRFETAMTSGTNFQKDVQIDIVKNNKVCFQYKANEYKVFVNGFSYNVTQRSTTPTGLSELSFNRANDTNPLYGKTKEIAYYDTVLTDEELETLTSYRSLNELVTELNLNTL